MTKPAPGNFANDLGIADST